MADCCGSVAYNPLNEICCNGRILTQSSTHAQCCGKGSRFISCNLNTLTGTLFRFDTFLHAYIFLLRLIDLYTIRLRKTFIMTFLLHSFTDMYLTTTHLCCGKNNIFQRKENHSCCGKETYDMTTHCCCINTKLEVKPKNETCCPKATGVCKQLL